MREQTVTVNIDADGSIRLDLDGFEGGTCVEAAKALLAVVPAPEPEIERKRPGAVQTTQRQTLTTGRRP